MSSSFPKTSMTWLGGWKLTSKVIERGRYDETSLDSLARGAVMKYAG